MRLQTSLLTATLTLLIAGRGQSSPASADRASRSGRTIILHPSEARFEIPTEWIAQYEKFHDNLHLSQKELKSVEVGAGEWDTEYAQVVNAALQFQDCIAHVGGEGWGKDGSSFGDVQLRIYSTLLNEGQVHQAAAAEGLSAAQKIDPHASVFLATKRGVWQKTSIKYQVFYGDYGGTARVDFDTRTYQGNTLVLVFMYCDFDPLNENDEVQSILSSFRFQIQNSDGKCIALW